MSTKPIVETVNIIEPDRLFMNTQLSPSEHFKQFVQCSESSGKSNDAVAEFIHPALSLMHGVHQNQFGQLIVGDFFFFEVKGRREIKEKLNKIARSCASKLGVNKTSTGIPLQFVNEHRRIWNAIWEKGHSA